MNHSTSSHPNDFASLRLDGDSRLQNLAKLVHFLSEKPGVVLTRYEVYVTIAQEAEGCVDDIPQYNSYIIKEGEPEVILDNKKKTSGCQTEKNNTFYDVQTQFVSTDTELDNVHRLNNDRVYYEKDRTRSLIGILGNEAFKGANTNNDNRITKPVHDVDIGDNCLSSDTEAFMSDSAENLLKAVLKSGVSNDLFVHIENCSVDPGLFSAKAELLEEQGRPFKCMKCDTSFQKEESLIVHDLIHSDDVKPLLFFKCPQCDFKSKSVVLISDHAQEKHHMKVFLCQWCKFVALSSDELAMHKSLMSHESNEKRKTVENQKVFDSSILCGSARKLLNRIDNSCPDNLRPFKCSKCFFWAHSALILESHIIAVHSGNGKYKCKDCNSEFKSMRKIRWHAQTEHNNSDLFFCFFCTFSCSDSKVHRNHLQSHYGKDRFSCDQCQYTCLHYSDLKRHQLIHSDKMPYGCCICGRHFRAKNNLFRHVAAHQEERDHQCETCGFRTKSKELLKTHWRVHQNVKEHMCQYCGYSTKYISNLYKHMVVHTEVKAFSCHLCSYTTKSPENLSKHKKRKHNKL
ncbi:zinc finger protein 729 [Biomphalaria glabrata]|nr:zinc finger protein 729 [Biomphalaria glabrata]